MNEAIRLDKDGQVERVPQFEKAELKCRIFRNPDGSPLKTRLTTKFPKLTRAERRSLIKKMYKLQKKQARAKA